MQSLIDLFNKLKDLNIDWNQVGDQLDKAKDKITKYLESEESRPAAFF
ncbi:Predicted secreted protein [Mycobacteroides abscessus subsp. abscessus]|nr:Predicted secreted protein [Mycobacteroides abscessus subsp. abscessus]